MTQTAEINGTLINVNICQRFKNTVLLGDTDQNDGDQHKNSGSLF